MKYKLSVAYERMKGFYSLPKNTLDMVFIGTSHFYYGIVPMKLWEDYGITSYVLAQESQPIECSYFYIKEVLKYQKPDVIVLDVISFLWYKYTPAASTLHKSVDYMKWGKNKIDAILKVINDQNMYQYFNAYLKHDTTSYRIKSYQDIYNAGEFVTGDLYSIWILKQFEKFANINKIVEVHENFNINVEQKYEKLEDKYILYINKIIKLASQNNIKLLFVNMPYAPIAGHKMFSEQVETILKEHQIKLLDFNRNCICENIDLKNDFYNKDHLNYWGARKVTKYIGAFIMENFPNTLKDKRDILVYDEWDKYNFSYSKRYQEIMELEYLKKEERKRLDNIGNKFFREDFEKYVKSHIDVNLIYSSRGSYYGTVDKKIQQHKDKYCIKLDYRIQPSGFVSVMRVFIEKNIKDWSKIEGIEIVLNSDNSNSSVQIKIWDCIEQVLGSNMFNLLQNEQQKIIVYRKDLKDPRVALGYDRCPQFVFEDINIFELCIFNNNKEIEQSGNILIESIKLF